MMTGGAYHHLETDDEFWARIELGHQCPWEGYLEGDDQLRQYMRELNPTQYTKLRATLDGATGEALDSFAKTYFNTMRYRHRGFVKPYGQQLDDHAWRRWRLQRRIVLVTPTTRQSA